MAFAALRLCVCAFEREAGHTMVELRWIPMDQAKCAAVMFIVATLALLVIRLRVQAFLRVDARSQCGVAGEAFRRTDAASCFMALQAICGPFEFCVRLAQWSGRDLRVRAERDRNQVQQREDGLIRAQACSSYATRGPRRLTALQSDA